MTSVKRLPVSDPLSKAYLHNAYQLSILGSREDTKTWIFMNYIQLVSKNGDYDFPVTFYLPDYEGYNWSILTPWFDYKVISREFVVMHDLDFGQLIRNAISNDEYVYFYVNERHIPGTPAEIGNYDYNHMILVHGYDFQNDDVFFFGYDQNGRFSERFVNVKILKQAYFCNQYTFERFENRVYFIKLRSDAGFKLKLEIGHIIEQFIDLKDSKRKIGNVLDYHTDFHYTYGLDVYDNVIRNIQLVHDGEFEDTRTKVVIPLQLIMEHKHIMIERLKFINQYYPSANFQTSIMNYGELKHSFEGCKNSVLKYEILKNKEILQTVMRDIEVTKTKEQTIISQLIENLRPLL